MLAKDGLRLNDLRCTEQARPEPGQSRPAGPGHCRAVDERTPQGDAELMVDEQVLGFKSAGDLKKSMTNIASEWRSANIVRDHAMILLDDTTPKPDGIFGKHTARSLLCQQ
jgi:hypothetical protein